MHPVNDRKQPLSYNVMVTKNTYHQVPVNNWHGEQVEASCFMISSNWNSEKNHH